MTITDAIVIALCVLGTSGLLVSAHWTPAKLSRGDAEIERRTRRLVEAAREEG